MTQQPLPYGIHDRDHNLAPDPGPPERIRCFVRGCTHVLELAKKLEGPVCPQHGIRCNKSTFSYADPSRNAIAATVLFGQRLVGHPDKFDTEWLIAENSEDTLSWNVFRSFQEAGALGTLATEVFGLPGAAEPQLYMWGLKLSDDSLSLWPLLAAARRRFESNLPVKRPPTEPDIALYVPGQYLALIEAKFMSDNTDCWAGRPRGREDSLTFEELLNIYWDPSLQLLDLAKAKSGKRLYYQLWRNMIFAEWMSREDSPTTKAYHFNLVRERREEKSAAEFHELLCDGFRDRFRRITWELIYELAKRSGPKLDRLCTYMETKTASLRKAFRIPTPVGDTP
jgi:hypothetical protein